MRTKGAVDKATLTAAIATPAGRQQLIPLPAGVRVWLANGYTDILADRGADGGEAESEASRDPTAFRLSVSCGGASPVIVPGIDMNSPIGNGQGLWHDQKLMIAPVD